MPILLAPAFYAIPIPLPGNPLKSLNAYVITGQRNLLVDTGFRQEACRQALLSGLAELGISMDNTDIFLTHLHSDHTGLAPEIRGRSTRIYIGAEDLSHMPGKIAPSAGRIPTNALQPRAFPVTCWRCSRSGTRRRGFRPSPMTAIFPCSRGTCFPTADIGSKQS